MLIETSRGLAWLKNSGQEAFAGLWRFYVFVPAHATHRAAAAAGELFGVPSEFAGS